MTNQLLAERIWRGRENWKITPSVRNKPRLHSIVAALAGYDVSASRG